MPAPKRDNLYRIYYAYLVFKGYAKLRIDDIARELNITKRAAQNFVVWLLRNDFAIEISDKEDRRKRIIILKRRMERAPLNATV